VFIRAYMIYVALCILYELHNRINWATSLGPIFVDGMRTPSAGVGIRTVRA